MTRKTREALPRPAPAIGHTLLVIAGLVAIDLLVFAQIGHHGFFTLDDGEYVTENAVVRGGLTWAGVVWAFTTGHFPYWHPLTWISHMLDVEWFGLDAGAHHLTNLALHIGNTVLLFLGLQRVTGAQGRSACVAALFGVHPLHVESVAWITERKDVLSTLFWWLTIGAYVAYVRRPTWTRYAVTLLAFALALMAKPMVVTLPAVLLILDIWPLRRTPLIREKLPFFGMAALAALATVLVQQHVGAVVALTRVPILVRLTHPFVSYVAYLGKAVWPAGLIPFYTYPNARQLWPAAGAVALLSAVSFLVFRVAKRAPYLAAGWLWYLVTLLPVIGFIQAGSQAMADRFTYVPLVGIFVIVTWGAADLAARWPVRRVALPALAAAAILACAVTARIQTSHWIDSETLWRYTLEIAPDNFLARGSLGLLEAERGHLAEARDDYSRAVALNPDYVSAQNNLALMLAGEGRTDEALAHLTRALEAAPDSPDTHTTLGAVLASQGKIDEAIRQYEAAIRADPSTVFAHYRLGLALAAQSKTEAAIREFSETIRIRPGLAAAWNSRGIALAGAGNTQEAIRDLSEALRLKPDFETARRELSAIEATTPGLRPTGER